MSTINIPENAVTGEPSGIGKVSYMYYWLGGKRIALSNLVVLFRRACKVQRAQIAQTKATIILVKLPDDAKEPGSLEEVPEASEGCGG